ncbi:unnamed protein product [Peniophora sp. CBMAI 1063]|nr:unnamed protein product [Peniophora sp. CBMAI 1063]
MSPLFRILHSTARAVANLVCAPPALTDGTAASAHHEYPLTSTATLYLRLVAANGGPPSLPLPADFCTNCLAQALDNPLMLQRTTQSPPQPKSPPKLRQGGPHSPADCIFSDSSELPHAPSPMRTPRRKHRRDRRPRLPLVYPPAPRLDWSPPTISSTPAGPVENASPASEMHGLGIGLGLRLSGLGMGILPRCEDEDCAGAPSGEFVRDLVDALTRAEDSSLPELTPDSALSSAPSTVSPPSLTSLAAVAIARTSPAVHTIYDDDSDDDDHFFSRPRPRPPVRKAKARRVPLVSSPEPYSTTDGYSSSVPSAEAQPMQKPRASLSITRPPPIRARTPHLSTTSFDQDTAASAARRVMRISSVGSLSLSGSERRPWK